MTEKSRLRKAAEERQLHAPPPLSSLPPLDLQRALHELQVHQIELEVQNEELQQAHARETELLAQYTELYEFAPAGYLSLDRDGIIRQVNLTGMQLLGVERSRLVNRRMGVFVAEADRRAFNDFVERVFAGDAKEVCEVTLPQNESAAIVVHIEGTRSAAAQECHAVMMDISARRRAEEMVGAAQVETQNLLLSSDQSRRALLRAAADQRVANEALRESENRYRELFENLPDGILIIDPQTAGFLEFNTAAHQQLGYSREEFARLTIHDLEVMESVEDTRDRIAENMQKGRVDFESLQRTRQGEVRNVHVTAQIVQVRGQPIYQCVWRDITARKQAEAKLLQKMVELSASNVELEHFNRAVVERELRMIELKEEINELCRRLREAPRYPTPPLETNSIPAATLSDPSDLSAPSASA